MLCFFITKRRTKINLKTKNTQNCQKIKLYGSLTTKELKKHSTTLVGGLEMGSWVREDTQQGVGGWWTGWVTWKLADGGFHIHVHLNQEEQLGSGTDHATQGSSAGK